jgi:hypothetical protein
MLMSCIGKLAVGTGGHRLNLSDARIAPLVSDFIAACTVELATKRFDG